VLCGRSGEEWESLRFLEETVLGNESLHSRRFLGRGVAQPLCSVESCIPGDPPCVGWHWNRWGRTKVIVFSHVFSPIIICFTAAGRQQTQCIVPVETNDKLANDMGIPKGTIEGLERLSSTRSPAVADLKVVQFSFKALDGTVSHFQILVESITFCNEL